jgi:hypothetical protein
MTGLHRKAKLRISSLALLAAALLSSGSGRAQQSAVNFAPSASGQTIFVMPSHDIECTFTPQGGTATYKPQAGSPELSCDRREPKYARVILTPTFLQKFENLGNLGCCGTDHPFSYGARWSKGPFTCESQTGGLTCKRNDGRGFVITRERIDLF